MATRRSRPMDSTSTASSRSISNTLYGICESDCEWNSPHYQYKHLKNQLQRVKVKKELAYEVFQLAIFNYKENPNKETARLLLEEKRSWDIFSSQYESTEFRLTSLKYEIRFGNF